MADPRDLDILRSLAQRIPAGDARAHNNLGVVYYRRGLYAEAVEQLERALELAPKLNAAQRNLRIVRWAAGYYQQMTRAEQADRSGSGAAELMSSDVEAEACLSLDGHNMARYEELVGGRSARSSTAEDDVLAPELDPPDQIAATESRRSEAIHNLADVLTVEPNHVPALVRLGDLLADAGKEQEASVVYRRALRLDPSSARARAGLERLAPTPEP